jgi:hypothetical protein
MNKVSSPASVKSVCAASKEIAILRLRLDQGPWFAAGREEMLCHLEELPRAGHRALGDLELPLRRCGQVRGPVD